ncbi:MAG: hypothetical protein C4293_16050 [Nitrospiraceae bacterium]
MNGESLGSNLHRARKQTEQVVKQLQESQARLQERIDELQKFEEVVVRRELILIQLEKEVEQIRFQQDRLQTYLVTGLMALRPTLAAGWLYTQAQAQAGVQSNLSTMSVGEVLLWYGLTPVTAAFFEETIWRGYAIPRLQGTWRSLLFTSLSFALFHGIFNPLALITTFVQGLGVSAD